MSVGSDGLCTLFALQMMHSHASVIGLKFARPAIRL